MLKNNLTEILARVFLFLTPKFVAFQNARTIGCISSWFSSLFCIFADYQHDHVFAEILRSNTN